jgi:exodeoxyribonuclease-3
VVKKLKILCWNVNGVRAAQKHGLIEWLNKVSPDILCLQETKATPDQLDVDLREPGNYQVYWNYPERKGYGGVATFAKQEPVSIQTSIGVAELDVEGRVIISEYPEFTLFNVYFPNGKKDAVRLKYKMDFYDAFFDFVEPMRQKGDKFIICGDFNTAHKEIDIARPKENEKNSGFLPKERAWLDKLVAYDYVDTFRHFHLEPDQYTWWDLKTRARERNVGWRLDYFFVSENLLPFINEAFIMPEVMGSDHCPIGLILGIP